MTDKGKEIDTVEQGIAELDVNGNGTVTETVTDTITETEPTETADQTEPATAENTNNTSEPFNPTAEAIDKSAKLAQGTAEPEDYLPDEALAGADPDKPENVPADAPLKTDGGKPVDIDLVEPSNPAAAVVAKDMPEIAAEADAAVADEAAVVATEKGLPKAPDSLVSKGLPNFGIFQGEIKDMSWDSLEAKPYNTKWHHKKWEYVGIAADDYFFGIAVCHVGWSSTAFAYMFDRKKEKVTKHYTSNAVPLLTKCEIQDRAFGNALYSSLGNKIQFTREGDVLKLSVDVKKLAIEAEIDLKGAPILCSVARANWIAHSTHKTSGLPIKGHVLLKEHHKTKDLEFDLPENAVASLDSSNGLLARNTEWLWASAHTKDLGFNLQQGYMGKNENAIWVDGDIYPVGNAIFEFDRKNPLGEWKIKTDDGKVDLTFYPEGARGEEKDLGLAASYYIQPVGLFRGTLEPVEGDPIEIEILGVTEDHESKW
ncbi:YALIA101S02e18448g1_1 [Yarrowia lipolytica]|nr:Hypothetical protein YALI2_F00879g [Yarrowia lipolytica]SEI32477.1 YALIA101S02e18448g1_1 [Yarrowia lipolytica]